MTSPPIADPLLTLEPLLEAVREAIVGAGWELSGLQKTTSHEFEGRWAGESTRSAYLFFHPGSASDSEGVSIDVYLDETSRGLRGNLALVVDGPTLAELGDAGTALGALALISREHLPADVRLPLTLCLRLRDGERDPAASEVEVRFTIHLPRRTISAGADEVERLVDSSVTVFEGLLLRPDLRRILHLP